VVTHQPCRLYTLRATLYEQGSIGDFYDPLMFLYLLDLLIFFIFSNNLDYLVVDGEVGGGSGVAEVASIAEMASGIGGGSSVSGGGMSISYGGSMGNSNGGSMGNSNGGSMCNSNGGSNGMDSLLDGVSSGLMDNGLVDGLVSGSNSGDGDLSVYRHVLEDRLGNVVGSDNGGGLVGGNGGGDMGLGGLSDRVGQGGNLGDDLGISVCLCSRVGKVTSKSVVLNGSTVMSGSPDEVRRSSQGSGSQRKSGGDNGGRAAGSQKSREDKEPVHDDVVWKLSCIC